MLRQLITTFCMKQLSWHTIKVLWHAATNQNQFCAHLSKESKKINGNNGWMSPYSWDKSEWKDVGYDV